MKTNPLPQHVAAAGVAQRFIAPAITTPLVWAIPLLLVVTSVSAHQGASHSLPAQASALISQSTANTATSSSALNNELNAVDIEYAAVENSQSPVLGGQWSAVYQWPLVAVHASLLPTGKVLAWDATPDDADDDPHSTENYTTRVTLWDPINNTHVQTNNDTDTDLFCAGSAHLWDGRVLFAGGDGGRAGDNGPLANSNIYNPNTNTWHRTENMNAPRWYSSVAALPNGEMLTIGGHYTPNPLAEVFQFDQTWRALGLPSDVGFQDQYQWVQATPAGHVLSFGPGNSLANITTDGQGSYQNQGPRDNADLRDYGSYAMYDVGRILVAGGGDTESTTRPGALDSAVVIETASNQVQDTASMHYARRQHNLTILADGTVLATGGNSDNERLVSLDNPVMTPEIWDPATGNWTTQNAMQRIRQYHSIALLLPDGRVLSAGGGICGDCYAQGYQEQNAEIFSPPYLFSSDSTPAIRPRLGIVPGFANYAETLRVGVDNSAAIAKVHLIKLGSPTHSANQDQRLVPLAFSRENGALSLTMPASRNDAPPGHYMLFIVNHSGVPSVASMIKIGQPLVVLGDTIATTLENGALDVFEVKADSAQIKLQLAATTPVSLYAGFSAPTAAGGFPVNLCAGTTSANNRQECTVSVPESAALYVWLRGSARADYRLAINRGDSSGTGPDTPESVTGGGTQTSNDTGTGGNEEGTLTAGLTVTDSKVRVGSVLALPLMLILLIWQRLFRVARGSGRSTRLNSRPATRYCYTGDL